MLKIQSNKLIVGNKSMFSSILKIIAVSGEMWTIEEFMLIFIELDCIVCIEFEKSRKMLESLMHFNLEDIILYEWSTSINHQNLFQKVINYILIWGLSHRQL